MANKGFTLIEIMVVLIIVGILAVISIPSFTQVMGKNTSNSARNTLVSIYNAEKTYYFANGNYCPNGCNIQANLNVAVPNDGFTYTCGQVGGTGFVCTATNPTIILTLSQAPLVFLSGNGCADYTGANCNPKCAPAASALCPS